MKTKRSYTPKEFREATILVGNIYAENTLMAVARGESARSTAASATLQAIESYKRFVPENIRREFPHIGRLEIDIKATLK